MHICSTHGCHVSQAHAGFCTDCMAVHAAGFSLSLPTVMLAALGAGLIVFAATRLLRSRTPAVAAA